MADILTSARTLPLTRDQVADRVRAVIGTEMKMDMPGDRMTESASLTDDLGLDSLDIVACVIDLETSFDIELTDAAMATIVTLGDATDAVIAALASAGRPVAEGVA
jgi:acyl carrier protein